MADAPTKFGAIVDYGAKEILCLGPFYVQPAQLATITFTNPRPNAARLFNEDNQTHESVVAARIVTSFANLVALRDLLNRLLPVNTNNQPAADMPGGSSTVH